jgi:SAM-dependent methyltransferase
MTEPTPRAVQVFFDVFEALPRQGPGDRASTARAVGLCRGLPPEPWIVDLGCGVGAQTLDLADLTGGTVVGIDNHAPFLRRLAAAAAERGVADRVHPVAADMAAAGLRPGRFDLVWSEGALYQLGLEQALPRCRALLHPGGCLAFTDAVWRRADVPVEVRAVFADYPTMGTVAEVRAAVERAGFEVLGHFALPDDAWWADFYTPMLARVGELRAAPGTDREATAVLDQLDAEAELHRRRGDCYGYECFVARSVGDGGS